MGHVSDETYLSFANLRRGLLLAAIVAFGYFIPNNFVLFTPHELMLTRLDHWVSLSPEWVWFYISYYAFLIFAYFYTTRSLAQRVYFGAMSLAALVGFVIFMFFPTIISRDLYPWSGPATYSSLMLQHIRGADFPVSCLPSMHISMSFIAASCISLCSSRALRAFVWAWFLAIAYSTMATKQHYFVDIVAGLALGSASVAAFMRAYGFLPDDSTPASPGGSTPGSRDGSRLKRALPFASGSRGWSARALSRGRGSSRLRKVVSRMHRRV